MCRSGEHAGHLDALVNACLSCSELPSADYLLQSANSSAHLGAVFKRDVACDRLWGSICLEPAAAHEHHLAGKMRSKKLVKLAFCLNHSFSCLASTKMEKTHLRIACSLSSMPSSASATPMERS